MVTYYLPSFTSCGGVGVFVINSLKYSIRNELCSAEKGLYETLWLDVFCNNKTANKLTFGIIYRHPGLAGITLFTNHIESTLNIISQNNSNIFLCGDFNINSLNYETYPIISSYFDTMFSYNLNMLINKPTRFSKGNQIGAPSLIDHFYTNATNKITKIGLITTDISDHLPIIAKIKINNTHKPHHKVVWVKDYNNADPIAFNIAIGHYNQYMSDNILTIEEKFSKLQDHITHCIDKYIPLRKITKHEINFSAKPWISRGIQVSIRHKNNLYNKIILKNRLDLKPKYNMCKKKLEKLIFLAKRKYYADKIDSCNNSSKLIWRIINEITSRKKIKQGIISHLKLENGTKVMNPYIIAD